MEIKAILDRRMDMEGWVDGWNGWMDGMDGWMNE